MSTAHLPKQMRQPAGLPGAVVYVAPGTPDAILWVPGDPDRWAAVNSVPDEVLVILRYARRHGCDFVLFDPEAPVVEGLPRWPG